MTSSVGLLPRKLQETFTERPLDEGKLSFLCGYMPRGQLLIKCNDTVVPLSYFLRSCRIVFQSSFSVFHSHILTGIWCCHYFRFNCSDRSEVVSYCGFVHVSLVVNGAEHLLMNLVAICASFSFFPFFKVLFE